MANILIISWIVSSPYFPAFSRHLLVTCRLPAKLYTASWYFIIYILNLNQLIYCQIGRGYSKELFDPHWCYVLKHCGTKLIVVPGTSIKQDSGTLTVPYEYDIEEDSHIKARMHFDDIRCVDKMRILEKKGYINIITPRIEIEKAISIFLTLQKKPLTQKNNHVKTGEVKKNPLMGKQNL